MIKHWNVVYLKVSCIEKREKVDGDFIVSSDEVFVYLHVGPAKPANRDFRFMQVVFKICGVSVSVCTLSRSGRRRRKRLFFRSIVFSSSFCSYPAPTQTTDEHTYVYVTASYSYAQSSIHLVSIYLSAHLTQSRVPFVRGSCARQAEILQEHLLWQRVWVSHGRC